VSALSLRESQFETALRPVLVIKLSALGDFIQALGPIAAIRRHHVGTRIDLLTTAPFAALGEACPHVDRVLVDDRPGAFDVGGWLALRRSLRAGGYARVYDLQTSDRTGWYFRLMGPGRRPEWSGIARGCSHPHTNRNRDAMHTLDRQAEQLRLAGIAHVPAPDISWARAELARFRLAPRYVLMVPGGAAHRPAKRWPLDRYAALARDLAIRGLQPVVIGGETERPLGQKIAARSTGAIDLTGRTSLIELLAIAKGAAAAVGNDSGPMHVAAAAGVPSVVLFSAESDPKLCAPRGSHVAVLRRPEIQGLSLAEVEAALRLR
jgi:ADP-heptose:LPS heptosyltransferase